MMCNLPISFGCHTPPTTVESKREQLKKLLDDSRTGLRASSDTNKTRSAILAMFDENEKNATQNETVESIVREFQEGFECPACRTNPMKNCPFERKLKQFIRTQISSLLKGIIGRIEAERAGEREKEAAKIIGLKIDPNEAYNMGIDIAAQILTEAISREK